MASGATRKWRKRARLAEMSRAPEGFAVQVRAAIWAVVVLVATGYVTLVAGPVAGFVVSFSVGYGLMAWIKD